MNAKYLEQAARALNERKERPYEISNCKTDESS